MNSSDYDMIMRQAGYTAEVWLFQAMESIEKTDVGKMSDEAKAQVISGFMIAAAIDQHTMTMRDISGNKED